ncbi:MAG TPA: polysaccharide deacetylase family protein [Bacteroidales bacterium]|nr:polysaccharide deacetylase family protein [Bacteroidales bacterium]
MRIFRFPLILRYLYPYALFRIKNAGNNIFLTFDDSPTPGVTSELVKILKHRNIPATFFCIGKNVKNNPEEFALLVKEEFTIANHGFSHIRGWKTPDPVYISDVEKGSRIASSTVFRPPYGSMSFLQGRILSKQHRIVFWDLMVYDYDQEMTGELVVQIIRKNIRSGSIIVLHDNIKSDCHLFLNKVIDLVIDMGYCFGDLQRSLA